MQSFGGSLEEVAVGDSIGRAVDEINCLEVAGDLAITNIKKINGVVR